MSERFYWTYDYDAMFLSRYLQRERLMELSTGALTEVQGYIIDANLAIDDEETARKLILDWNAQRAKGVRREYVSKWTPGDHYYALNEKFNSLNEAIKHIEKQGFEYAGFRERYQYRSNGG